MIEENFQNGTMVRKFGRKGELWTDDCLFFLAAEKLGRKWIGIDVSAKTPEILEKRLLDIPSSLW